MSALRFKAGETALVNAPGHCLHGEEVEILVVGPFGKGGYVTWNGATKWAKEGDYLVLIAGKPSIALDSQLRKKRPPEEPQVTKLKEVITRWTSNKRPVSA